jgi:hypothetical protein
MLVVINEIRNETLRKAAEYADNKKNGGNGNGILESKEESLFTRKASESFSDLNVVNDYAKLLGYDVQKKDNAYGNYKRSEVQKEKKEKEIVRLKKDINNIREKLYKGRYSAIVQKQKGLTKSQKNAALGTCSATTLYTLGLNFFGGAALGISSIEALGISTAAATTYAGFLGAGAATLTAGAIGAAAGVALPGLIVAGGCYLYNKYTKDKDLNFIQQCQQENPELYNALKQAEKQLAELQK